MPLEVQAKNQLNLPLPIASSIHLQDFDRHIKGEPFQQAGAVVRIADAVRANPFPAFVNAVLIRLADAFRDGSNQLRLVITRAMRECSEEFALFSGNEDVVRRVIKVSHSNDDKARALMLQFASAIAQLVSGNKQLHHLLIESLDSESNVELLATIVAVENFCIHSVDFSHLVIWKISEMLLESKHSPILKARLIRVLSNFHGDFKTVSKVFDLGQHLIGETSDRYNLAALISSMTRLALKSRLTVERQLELLLSEMEQSNGNQNHLCLLLLNIKVLADLSQFWTQKHSAKFIELFEKYRSGNSNRVNAEWIGAFERLSVNCNVKILESIKEHIMNWSYLLSLGNIDIQLAMIGLMENILLRIPSHGDHLTPILSSTFHSLFSSNSLTRNHYKKLFKVFDAFLHTPYVLSDNVIIVSEQLTSSAIATNNFTFVIECLKKAANSHQSLQPHLKPWINRQIENAQMSPKNLCQLAELQFSCSFSDMDTGKWLSRDPEPDGWCMYKIARFALESGLWKQIAAPVLAKLREQIQSYETSLWIDALHHISESQITTATVFELGQCYEKLMKAELNFRVLVSIPSRSKTFSFPLHFTTALRELVSCAKTVIEAFSPNALNPSAAVEPTFREQFISKLVECLPKVAACRQTWAKIYGYLFDADAETMEYVYLLCVVCLMYERIVLTFSQEFAQCDISIPNIVAPSVRNQELHNVLFWTKANLEQFERIPLDARISSENIDAAGNVLRTILSQKICIPRYFFQQSYYTDIKLHVLPEPKENQLSVVPISRRFPVTVEGFIVSNNKTKIESLVITAMVRFEREKHNYEQKNSVTVQEGKYFKTQFLFDIYSSGRILFKTHFVDRQSKRLWSSDSTAQMNVTFAG
ncbi:hypothetical protein QR680_017561 [Steinernema hermaphroditum]|uniref:Integrator complex subunit 7 n=1 Tax=Steinernema hermaphroditum TaxID=289476 RepID=A0AA39HF17_9BILA|nr:hypothetical protein QR680_017561 [Steinernema hermaphroditum]